MTADLPRRAAWALAGACALSSLLVPCAVAETKLPRPGTDDHRLLQRLLKDARISIDLKGGWEVEGPTHIVHSTISKEYAALAAVHLSAPPSSQP